MSYPFRFYGARPGDWYQGANCGHFYEMRFQAPPDEPARAGIARAFESALVASTVETDCKSWLWCEAYALVCIGERFHSDARAFHEDMQVAMRAVHASWPLEQVIFHGVREQGPDPWSDWSVERQAAATIGPDWAGWASQLQWMGVYSPQGERGPVGAEVDTAFDDARAEARRAAAAEKIADDAEAAAEVGGIAIVPCDVPDAPESKPSGRAAEILGPGARNVRTAGRFAAGNIKNRVVWADGDSDADTYTEALDSNMKIRAFDLSPTGLVAVVDNAYLNLLDPCRPSDDPRSSRQFSANYPDLVTFVLDGRILIVGQKDMEWPTAVIGIKNGWAKEIGRCETEIADSNVFEVDGRVYSSGGYEIVGLEARWGATFADDPTEDGEFDLEDDWWDEEGLD